MLERFFVAIVVALFLVYVAGIANEVIRIQHKLEQTK